MQALMMASHDTVANDYTEDDAHHARPLPRLLAAWPPTPQDPVPEPPPPRPEPDTPELPIEAPGPLKPPPVLR